MKKFVYLILSAMLFNVVALYAQDDVYFVPKKKKAKVEVVEENWTANRSDIMDVDAYNRRNTSKQNDVSSDDNDDTSAYEEGTYTSRIIRFHAPGVTLISSPYYTDYVAVWSDPWYVYRPYGFYAGSWGFYWGWNSPYGWYDPWWSHGWYDPWHYHAWYPHHHYYPGYHPGYYPGAHPGKPSYAVNPRPKRSSTIRDRYRPSTMLNSKNEYANRPANSARPSQNRNSVSTQRQQQNNSSRPSTSTSRPARERTFGTPSNSNRQNGSGFSTGRPSRSMNSGGGSSRGTGRRR